MGCFSRLLGYLRRNNLNMQADIKKVNGQISYIYAEYQKSILKKDGGILREYLSILLEMLIANFDFLIANPQQMQVGIGEFTLKLAVRPIVLRAYELEMAINPWSTRIMKIAKVVGAPYENSIVKGIRKKHHQERNYLLKLAKVRNTFGHSQFKEPGEFIKIIEGVDARGLKGSLSMVLDCLTALIHIALELLPAVQRYKGTRP